MQTQPLLHEAVGECGRQQIAQQYRLAQPVQAIWAAHRHGNRDGVVARFSGIGSEQDQRVPRGGTAGGFARRGFVSGEIAGKRLCRDERYGGARVDVDHATSIRAPTLPAAQFRQALQPAGLTVEQHPCVQGLATAIQLGLEYAAEIVEQCVCARRLALHFDLVAVAHEHRRERQHHRGAQ